MATQTLVEVLPAPAGLTQALDRRQRLRRPLARVPLTWVAPLFEIGLTTLTALMADLLLPPPWPPWALWAVIFAVGLWTLTFACRI